MGSLNNVSILFCFYNIFDRLVEMPDETQLEEFESNFQLGLEAIYQLIPPNSV
jgi:hypothetical protein